jgi:hypothetical protein
MSYFCLVKGFFLVTEYAFLTTKSNFFWVTYSACLEIDYLSLVKMHVCWVKELFLQAIDYVSQAITSYFCRGKDFFYLVIDVFVVISNFCVKDCAFLMMKSDFCLATDYASLMTNSNAFWVKDFFCLVSDYAFLMMKSDFCVKDSVCLVTNYASLMMKSDFCVKDCLETEYAFLMTQSYVCVKDFACVATDYASWEMKFYIFEGCSHWLTCCAFSEGNWVVVSSLYWFPL